MAHICSVVCQCEAGSLIGSRIRHPNILYSVYDLLQYYLILVVGDCLFPGFIVRHIQVFDFGYIDFDAPFSVVFTNFDVFFH